MNKHIVGSSYENLACDYIIQSGGRVIERNYRALRGEIDIIAMDGRYLCFIEVKYRKNNKYGAPEAAVTISKQKQICKISRFYLYSKKKSEEIPIRYDVIAISNDNDILTFKWHKNAFMYF